jgi:hypothetical protein
MPEELRLDEDEAPLPWLDGRRPDATFYAGCMLGQVPLRCSMRHLLHDSRCRFRADTRHQLLEEARRLAVGTEEPTEKRDHRLSEIGWRVDKQARRELVGRAGSKGLPTVDQRRRVGKLPHEFEAGDVLD